ncbi:MAG: hypothetical protein NT016_02900 [Candidatus Aenigmarchaeota archaeon]|nr:hypothetical protein [Candidatus Aenigmarchaeota archaeon]
MAKGEIPIGYIIALVLGIAVVAILGYWFFIMQSSGGSQMTATQCQAQAYQYCRTWQINNYQVENGVPLLGGFNLNPEWFSQGPTGTTNYAPNCQSIKLGGDGSSNTNQQGKLVLSDSCDAILNPGT